MYLHVEKNTLERRFVQTFDWCVRISFRTLKRPFATVHCLCLTSRSISDTGRSCYLLFWGQINRSSTDVVSLPFHVCVQVPRTVLTKTLCFALKPAFTQTHLGAEPRGSTMFSSALALELSHPSKRKSNESANTQANS